MKRNHHRLIGSLLALLASLNIGAEAAELYTFSNINKTIPDGNLSGMSDTRMIGSSISNLTSLKIRLQIAGEFNGDLYGYVRHVNGSQTNLAVLLNRSGRASTNAFGYGDMGMDVVFDDASTNGDVHFYRGVSWPESGTPLTNVWQPDGRKVEPTVVTEAFPRTAMLGSFLGANPNGEWTMYLVDADSGATNMLVNWAVEIDGAASPPITWSPPAHIVYGTALSASQLNASSSVPGSFSYSPPIGTVLNAGLAQTLTATFTPTDTSAYLVTMTNVTINVLKKDLTVTANDAGKVYGATLPTFSASYTGFVNGDTSAVISGSPAFTTAATQSSGVGGYSVTPSVGTLSAANYQFTTFVAGTLTVTPAPLAVTADPKSKGYGSTDPALTYIVTGLVSPDTISGALTRLAGEDVGGYAISQGTLSGGANYTISFTGSALTITPATLNVVAGPANKVYGATDPSPLPYTPTGFQRGDIAGTVLSGALSRSPGENAGTYAINQGTLAANANYTIAFTGNNLTITTATLAVAADAQTKVYGQADPALTYTATGWQRTDTASLLTGGLSRDPGENAGTYNIIRGTLSAGGNYTINFTGNTLTITKSGTTGIVSSSLNPAAPGTPVVFTMQLSAVAPGAGTPTGTVQFKIDGLDFGAPAPLTAGSASLASSALSHGLHAVSAVYSGDPNFTAVTSSMAQSQLINSTPVAGTDILERIHTNSVKVFLPDLMENDSDADSDSFLVVDVSLTSTNGGTVMQFGDWVFYLPPASDTNTDAFTYTIEDSFNSQATGTVLIQQKVDLAASPNLTLAELGDGSFLLRFDGIPGMVYRIEYTDEWPVPNWQTLATGTADEMGVFQLIDTPPASVGSRFYRSVCY